MHAQLEKSRIKVTVDKGAKKIKILPLIKHRVEAGILLAFSLLVAHLLIGPNDSSKDFLRSVFNPSESYDPSLFVGLLFLVIFVILVFYLGFYVTRGSFAETLLLWKNEMKYDPGMLRTVFESGRGPKKSFWTTLRKSSEGNRRITFSLEQIKTLKLRKVAFGNRLTIEHGNELYDLGSDISEMEREWFYQVLKEYYSLA